MQLAVATAVLPAPSVAVAVNVYVWARSVVKRSERSHTVRGCSPLPVIRIGISEPSRLAHGRLTSNAVRPVSVSVAVTEATWIICWFTGKSFASGSGRPSRLRYAAVLGSEQFKPLLRRTRRRLLRQLIPLVPQHCGDQLPGRTGCIAPRCRDRYQAVRFSFGIVVEKSSMPTH